MNYCQSKNIGKYKVCNNVAIGPNKKSDKRLYRVLLILAIVIGEIFDLLGWVISLIPIAGDIAGNAVVGNILDLIAFSINLFLYGNYAFYGASEFVDLISQWIPVIGDAISLIELLPASLFPSILYYFKKPKPTNPLSTTQ